MISEHQYTVLIIDDSPEDRATYCRYLQRDPQHTYHILETDSAVRGLERLQNSTPDVILLDYLLPDMDGLEFLKSLAQEDNSSGIPVVFITGQGNEIIASQAIKDGAQDYLIKGKLTADTLHKSVIHAIEKAQLQRQIKQQQQQQRMIAEITLRIRQSFSLQAILQTTVDEVQRLLQSDRVMIFRFTPGWGGVVEVEAVREESLSILPFQIYDPCLGEQYIEPFKQGFVTAKADIYEADISPCHVEFLAQFQVRANLAVPILKNNDLWGLLVAHQCKAPRQWQTSEIELLRQITLQVGIALQQNELVNQMQAELVERRKAEALLEERETLLRLFVRYAPAGIAMFDREMRYIMASQRWVDEYHLGSIVSLLNQSHYTVFPEIPDRWRQVYERCLAGAVERCDADLFRRADGTHQWISWEVRPWYTGSRDVGGIIIFSADITERRQAEVALHESQLQLQRQLNEIETLYQSAPIGLTLLDTDFRFVRINQRLANINGLPVEAHIGHTVRELLPDIADAAEHLLDSILETGEPLLNVEISGETPAQPGVKRTWIENFLPIKEGDRVIGINTVCEEITERKQAEEALQQSEARLRLAQIASHSAVWDWDILTNTLTWSPEYYQLYQLDPDIEASFDNWIQCIHPDDQAQVSQQILQVLGNDATDLKVEFRVLRSEKIRWFAGIGQVLRDEAGSPFRMVGITIDITQQKRTELALQKLNRELEKRVAKRTVDLKATNIRLKDALKEQQQAKQYVEDLYNNAPCGYHSLDINGTVVQINNTELSWLGYSHDEVLNKMRFVEFIAPENQKDFEHKFSLLLQQGWVSNVEFQLCHKQGATRWVSLNATATRDVAGNFVMSRMTLFDVSDRKQSEAILQQQTRLNQLRWEITQALRHSLDLGLILETAVVQLRQTLQADRVAVYQFQPDWSGNFVVESVRNGWERLAGFGVAKVWEDTYLQETQGGRFQNHETFVIPDIYTAGLQPCHVELLEQFQAKAFIIVPIFAGETLWGLLATYQNTTARDWQPWEVEFLQQIASQLAIALHQSQLYSQLQTELKERKQTEAVLREAERRWRSLLDNVQLVVIGLDKRGRVEYANPFFLELSGYPLDEVLGKSWFEHFLSPSQKSSTRPVFQDLLAGKPYPHYQNPIVTRAGEERMIAWSNTALQDISGAVIGTISIGEDITERYKIDRMKAEFISMVSHELRTPLTSMQAALSLLNEKIIEPTSEEGEATIQIAAEGTDRLVRLVNDILDLERLESGKVRLEKDLYQIDELVLTAMAQMQELAKQAGIQLEDDLCDVQAEVDGDRLLQVLTNLLSNAIKFSSNNSTIQLSIQPQKVEEGVPFLLFTIHDEGRGIPADKLESIFDRFHQVDASDSREKGGTGLGLAICQSIVQQHGGEIWAESTLGQGSTFYFTIPLSP